MRRKRRLDVELVERGLAPSRSRAQALVMAGKVLVDGRPALKAGTMVGHEVVLELRTPDHPYVSRGALKLRAALDELDIDPNGRDCLDVGASTGGFTQVLLERGARRVVALDVGRGQLDWKLRSHQRVTALEGFNARRIDGELLPYPVDLATVDVSFISLRLVVPPVARLLPPGGELICLVKPQFEAGRDLVPPGGVIRDERVRRRVIDDTVRVLENLGLERIGVVPSPVRGQRGNLEELAAFRVP